MTDLAVDDLTRPLGRAEGAARPRFSVPARTVAGVLAGIMVAAAGGQLWLGRRTANVAIAEITRAEPKKQPSASEPAVAARAEPAVDASKPVMNAQEMENASGVTVVRGAGPGAPQSLLIQIGQTSKPAIAPPDRKLLEKSRYGALPRIGADGARPSQVYARAAAPVAGKPRIAIVIGGVGVSQQATSDAIAKLPEQVSLAFAPYSGDLDRQLQRARDGGHELFLQAPMEPFDYPENDPGPHTLRVGASDADNLDKLQWVMSRIQGYVGVVNFMGAKFTAQETALKPMLKEIADRGLLLLDDGSSNRSRMVESAAALKAPAGRADSVIDGVLRGEAIDRELTRLEQIARDKGVAIGAASALPITIDRIARWAKGLEAKGIVLVPVSNAIAAPRKEAP